MSQRETRRTGACAALTVGRLSSMLIARLGRVLAGIGIATCLQAFIAIVAAGKLSPAHAAWPCTYAGQAVECSRPTKGVFRADEALGPIGGYQVLESPTEAGALGLLTQLVVQGAPQLIAAYSMNGTATQCAGGDGAPLTGPQIYRNAVGSSGYFEYLRYVRFTYYWGADVVWTSTNYSCGFQVNPQAGRVSGNAAFSRRDVCVGSFWTDWDYSYVETTDHENVDYAICYSCPAGKQWVSQRQACVSKLSVPRFRNAPDSCGVGNPIHPLRSVKRETVDLGVTIGATSLTLTYDSTPLVPKTPANLASSEGTQDQTWSVNLFKRIATTSVGASASVNPGAAQASRGNGAVVNFARNVSSGQYTAEANTADRLVSLGGGSLRYYDSKANTQETYDSTGLLTGQSWANGQRISLTYSDANTPSSIAPAAGYLIQASDNNGRVVNFTYTGTQLNITDAAGQNITLSYDASGNLASINWPDGRSKTFLYENGNGALTGIIDELNQRYATFTSRFRRGLRGTQRHQAFGRPLVAEPHCRRAAQCTCDEQHPSEHRSAWRPQKVDRRRSAHPAAPASALPWSATPTAPLAPRSTQETPS